MTLVKYTLLRIAPTIVMLLGSLYTAQLFAEDANTWRSEGQQALEASKNIRIRQQPAKNIILFVGDGMGVSTVTAARIFEGQLQGRDGERNLLAFEKLPFLAMAKTFSANQQTADSAPTMTAIMTGVKANDGVLSLNQRVMNGEKDADLVAQNAVPTLLEMAELRGLSTGVVTTTRVTHATPAATYAHTSDRDWENNAQLPPDTHIQDIAAQVVDRFGQNGIGNGIGNGLEVLMGGGRKQFLPVEANGLRTDGRNLIQEYQTKFSATYASDRRALQAIKPTASTRLLGLFADDHLAYETDRLKQTSQPSLSEMVSKAIDVLASNPKGYFLMVEAGRIDHAHHAGNAYRALAETVALSDAVKQALTKINLDETLIIVTADHSHTMSLSGYAKRGNPVLDKVVLPGQDAPALAFDQQPYTAINYINGQGHIDPADKPGHNDKALPVLNTGRNTNLTTINTQHPDFHQQALIPLHQETHAGEDVQIFADGPRAHYFHSVQDQSYIFYVMKDALGL
jgi:alkaline phosphatase